MPVVRLEGDVNTRGKGTAFEREVAAAFEAHGFEVRGLEAGGDHFTIARNGVVMHGESKRQERLQLSIWLRQQSRDCPKGMRRFLCFRQSRQPAYVVEPFEQFLEREARLAELEA